jgi:YVTN family beta-propeller protein
MEFRVLGPLEVVDDGRTLRLGSGKQLAVVAFLLLHANEAVSVDRIVDELWGESPPPTAAKIVRNYVSLLRRELGDRLVTQAPGYLLRVRQGELDREQLERAIESRDLAALTDAMTLWRGAPLSQLAYEPFAQAEIARLEELRAAAVEARFEAELAQGRHSSAIAGLEALVQQHPLRERLSELLMLALYRSGRQAEALETYQRARRILDERLGVEPGPGLRELERKILAQDESLGAPARPVPTPAQARRRSLALGAAGLLAAAVALVLFLTRDDSVGGLAEVRPNHVGVIDPGTNTVVAAIPVGIRPGPLGAAAGSVWVGNVRDRNLTRIDARRRSVTAAVSLGDRTPTGIALGAGAVWVAHGLRGELSRVDPQFLRVTDTLRLATRSSNGSVAFGEGHVWAVYGDSTLARVQPQDVREAGSALVAAVPSAVAVSGRAVWVVSSDANVVQRFDADTFSEGPIREVNVGQHPVAIAVGEGALWVANRGDDTVTRIDPNTGATLDIRVGDEPNGLAVGEGAVWVSAAGGATVSRIDPATNEVVRTIELGHPAAGIVVTEGLVWVAVQAS